MEILVKDFFIWLDLMVPAQLGGWILGMFFFSLI